MKKRTSAGFVLMAALFLHSCRPFCKCEPITEESLRTKIINPQGQNLIFGPQAIYKTDSIKALQNRNDVSVLNASVARFYNDSSILSINFYGPQNKSFLYYNRQATTDSVEIIWKPEKRKCCGEPFTYHSITQIKFNGTMVQPQNGTYVFVKP